MPSRIRIVAVALVAVAVTGAALAAGAHSGYPASRPRLLSGAAWLTSVQLGAVTLLDGSSAEVAGQVGVADPGDKLDVVQQGPHAYAVDRTTGTVVRVDGATFKPTDPVSPLPGAGTGLRVFAGPGVVYALDVDRGLLTGTDPATLAPRGAPVPLAARAGGQTAVLDGEDRLWVLDPATGTVTWLEHGRRHSRSGLGGGTLVLADDRPVVVDPRAGTATVLDPGSGAPAGHVDLALPPGGAAQVAGSPHTDRVYVTTPGALRICPLAGACTTAIPLGTGTTDLGAPVETGGRVFVPDYSAGRVWIVDLERAAVVGQPEVIPPKTPFQLLTRDGVVFFNDPDSARAGVIRLDGGVVPVAKYAASAPPSGSGAPGPVPSAPPTTAPPTEPKPQTPQPKPKPTPTPTPTAKPPAGIRLVVSTTTPLVNADVAMQVVPAPGSPAPSGARWDFGDGGAGTGLRVGHAWSAPRTYQISVTATFPDGRTAVASLPIRVITPPVLTVSVSGGGAVTGPGIDCRATCRATYQPGQRVTLTANPDNGSGLRAWGGACGGSRSTCTVTMNGSVSVSASFATRPTLTVEEPAIDSITGPNINCPGTCTATYNPGQTITLTGVASPGTQFGSWETGPCAGSSNPKCRFTINADTDVSAVFDIVEKCPPICPARTAGPEPGGGKGVSAWRADVAMLLQPGGATVQVPLLGQAGGTPGGVLVRRARRLRLPRELE